jgi:hypothetical protein
MLTKRFQFLAPFLFAASLALGGCASANSAIEADENVNATSEAANAAADDHHGPRGMHGHPLLVAALKEIDLSADQRTKIEAAINGLHADKDKGEQMKAFHKALADDIRAARWMKRRSKPNLATWKRLMPNTEPPSSKPSKRSMRRSPRRNARSSWTS